MQQIFVSVWRFESGRRPGPADKQQMADWANEQREAGLLHAWGWAASPICNRAMAILTVPHMAEALELVLHCPISKLGSPDLFEWIDLSVSADALGWVPLS